MIRWRCRRVGCDEAGEASTGVAAVAEQWEHVQIVHVGAAARAAEARTAQPLVKVPGLEPARLLGDPALTVILEPGQLVNPHGGAMTVARPAHVGSLVDVVTEAVGAIFVTAAAAAWIGLPESAALPAVGKDASHPFVEDARAAGWLVEPDGLAWVLRVRRSARSRPISVVLLSYDAKGYAAPWSGLAGAELAAGLRAFRDAVGLCAGPSASSTAERLLLALHNQAKGGARLDASPVLPPAVGELGEIGSLWRLPLTDGADPLAGLDLGRYRRWVVWFDANANYLGAYQTAELGRGEPEPMGLGMARDLITARRPDGRLEYLPAALWCVNLPAQLPDGLPVPWSTSARWHTSPTIGRARELLDVDELAGAVTAGLRWPLKSRFCEPFGAAMRDARARLLEVPDAAGAGPALRAVAMAYQRLHGRFGAGFRAGSRSAWYRPDWMHTIRAQARVNLDRRIRALSAAPFAVDVDALYFVSDIEDPEAFAAHVGLPLGPRDKLGAFRVAGCLELTGELAKALAAIGTAQGTRNLLAAVAAGGPVPAPVATAGPAAGHQLSAADEDVDGLDELEALLAAG